MFQRTRREVLQDVGKGLFVATLGGVAADLGLGTAWAADEPGTLTFGDLDPLVAFIHDTPADKLLPKAVEKLRAGTDLKQLVAAAALANARAFGGEDYVGFHTLMALAPAYHMAAEEPDEKKRPLAVLKVLVRNATRLGETGRKEVLKEVRPADKTATAESLRDAVRKTDLATAESTFAALAKGSPTDALENLMPMVDDATEVHRVVLVSRSWDLLDFVGKERAHTLLRQSVRFCVKGEQSANYVKHFEEVRAVLPKLLDQHKLLGKAAGTKAADDAWVEAFADTLFRATPSAAAEAAAAALAEGMDPAAVSEAIALVANQLVLRDEGRPKGQTAANKPTGSCHGDSIGVHACDSANAWRAIARTGGWRTTATSLILGAYQVAMDRAGRGGDFLTWKAYPRAEHLEQVQEVKPDALLKELDGAIREGNQPRAAALAHRLSETEDVKKVFALLRGFAVSEDGALHAEKFYRTTVEEFAAVRPVFRNRYLAALSRVTASAHGYPAPGYKEACDLLKV